MANIIAVLAFAAVAASAAMSWAAFRVSGAAPRRAAVMSTAVRDGAINKHPTSTGTYNKIAICRQAVISPRTSVMTR